MRYWIRIGAFLTIGACLLAACLLAAFLPGGGAWWQAASPDGSRPMPGVAARSVAGERGYVDDHACAECHADEAEKQRRSGHADTFRLTSTSPAARELAGKVYRDPERNYSYAYAFDAQSGLSVTVPERLGNQRFPLQYELGSGQHAVTFLTLLPDRLGDTVGLEHRVSLYRGKSGWELDLTPGHQQAVAGQDVEQFGKVLRGDTLTRCIGCHTTVAEIAGHQLAELHPHVGCQSCHGPGRGHVAAQRSGGQDEYAGFGSRSAAQELALCGRCHRLPEDGVNAELSPNLIENVRFQPAGLIQSRCYTASGNLRCTTCHDPHAPVLRDRDHYVRRCLDCHGGSPATVCPVSPRERCVDCHMPAIAVHRGIEFHDHWIRVRRDVDPKVLPAQRSE